MYSMVVGIPKAFLYYRYHVQWESFFDTLNIEYVISGNTTKEILRKGGMYAIDEACLSSKIYLGHVDSLIDKCDVVFVPRIANFGHREILCTKFSALYDIVENTFKDRNIKLLDYNIDLRHSETEMSALLYLGKRLSKKKYQVMYSFMGAKQADRMAMTESIRRQNTLLEKEGLKILIVGHSYNVYDACIGKPVTDMLKALGVTPIYADVVDRKRALERAAEITDTLPWTFNRELVGAVQEYRDYVDGIILLSAFPCGPDSLVNDIILRRVKGIPILNLVLDYQDGTAGIETRLESFVDIITFKKEGMI